MCSYISDRTVIRPEHLTHQINLLHIDVFIIAGRNGNINPYHVLITRQFYWFRGRVATCGGFARSWIYWNRLKLLLLPAILVCNQAPSIMQGGHFHGNGNLYQEPYYPLSRKSHDLYLSFLTTIWTNSVRSMDISFDELIRVQNWWSFFFFQDT